MSSAGDGGLILGVEIRRSEFGTKPNTWPLADTHIPNGFSMPGDFPMQVRRARAWHGADHRTISEDSSRAGIAVPVDGAMRIMIASRSPMRTSTSLAPTCFAARIARAISACVMLAGRRLMGRRASGTWTAGGKRAYRRSFLAPSDLDQASGRHDNGAVASGGD